MAVSSPEATVQLNEADLQKLELATQRLSVVQREVLNATKELASLDEELSNARKSKVYLDEQLTTLESQVKSLSSEKERLDASIQGSNILLEEHHTQRVHIQGEHAKREQGLNGREEEIARKENLVAQRALELEAKAERIEKDRAEVDHARDAFIDALSAVTWQ